jgi:hypothetical protein
VTERAPPLDDTAMKFGLLMEGAQAHQKLAESHLERLHAHTQGLDQVVRDAIRRTVVEELRELTVEIQRALGALRGVKRAVNIRTLLWSLALSVLSTAIPLSIVRYLAPSTQQVETLRIQRDQLTASVAQLEQRGGRIEWRKCGEAARLCVRVDRDAPSYGDKGDYLVIKGY